MGYLGGTRYGGHDGKSKINWRLEDGREGYVTLNYLDEDQPGVKTVRRVIDQETGEVLADLVYQNGELLSEHPRPIRGNRSSDRMRLISGMGADDMWID
jgi:hypothetical protein